MCGIGACGGSLLARDHGTIVQVGSTLVYRGIPLPTAYCGAKHAIEGFTEALRCELLHQRSRVRLMMVQLPAVNTPQFDWVLNRQPNRPRPVAPVYQPEVVARAVVHAADHPGRREYWVARSTVGTLTANKLVPGLLDRYLARTGYEAQQPDQPADPERPVNLWELVDGPVAVTSAHTGPSTTKRSTTVSRPGSDDVPAWPRPPVDSSPVFSP
jgi:hypothetical protein